MNRRQIPDFLRLPAYLAKWSALSLLVALLAGAASFIFLSALDWATQIRTDHPWLIWLLPVAGFAVGWIYLRYAGRAESGNNLLIDEIHEPKQTIPLRMAPLVLFGTVTAHLFGASIGREGTAVQMGGALADQITHRLKLSNQDRSIVLTAGIAAGFASVFGTPLAGAVFALEVLVVGRLRHDAILPCLIAALAADAVGQFLGVRHTHYAIEFVPALSPWGVAAMALAGIAFGLVARAFAVSIHALGGWMGRHVGYAPLRPLVGGLAVALAVWLLGTDRYVGLGIPVILESFQQPVAGYDWLGKLGFTVVSLGSGFKGGEVTPLFYIGATLGNALAPLLHMPFALLAGVGFVAVFAGATNTPLASTLMAIELFGAEAGVYAMVACVVSYLCSGPAGIYRAQRSGGKPG